MGSIKNRCVIIGGGDCSAEILKEYITPDDYVICADSGFDYALSAGITPDLLIGDFDSISHTPDNINKITLPVEKDVTDCEAAYCEGLQRGYVSFILFGGTGGRFEHTFANISVMARASKENNEFILIDEKHRFSAITNGTAKIKNGIDKQVSVFAFGDKAYGVSENGFHYLLNNYTLDPFIPIGISNDVTGEFGEISVQNGTLIIIETQM